MQGERPVELWVWARQPYHGVDLRFCGFNAYYHGGGPGEKDIRDTHEHHIGYSSVDQIIEGIKTKILPNGPFSGVVFHEEDLSRSERRKVLRALGIRAVALSN